MLNFLILLFFGALCYDYNTDEYNNGMYWGSYQPQLYFGLKTKSTDPVKFGMMWNNIYSNEIFHETTEQFKYGWTDHDGEKFGIQKIFDTKNNVLFTTEFVKSDQIENGGNWIAKVSGRRINKEKKSKISMLFYMAMDSDLKNGDFLSMQGKFSAKGSTSPVIIKGRSVEKIGKFMVFIKDMNVKSKEKFSFSGARLPKDKVWRIKDVVNQNFMEVYMKAKKKFDRKQRDEDVKMPRIPLVLNNKVFKRDPNNYVVVQKIVSTDSFSFQISFVNEKYFKKRDVDTKKFALEQNFEKLLNRRVEEFEKRFESVFQLKEKNLDKFVPLGKYALSNMFGGIGVFHGDSIQEGDDDDEIRKVLTQFSGVPSRSKFPRPFLWDEGFHLELIMKFNKKIGKDIINHWFNTMDNNGWIPREQILGDEGRSRVPKEFVLQSSVIANPPTIFLALENLIPKSLIVDEKANVGNLQGFEKDLEFLKNLYPLLKKNHRWYLKTQKMPNEWAFQWKGRTENHTLASGFDDYPRGTITPSPQEKHLDLYCWIFMITRTMRKISSLLNIKTDYEHYDKLFTNLKANFQSTHFDSIQDIYSDYVGWKTNYTSLSGYSKHIGYVTLFPLISEITNKNLKGILQAIGDQELLSSPFGLRSLSASDRLFGTKENYWRGKIWININYLTLKALRRLSDAHKKNTKLRKLYSKLRKKLIQNMFKIYTHEKTIFENYNPHNGRGTGTHPFTGWSSLILLILSEKY